jgi:hypothetical protein
VIGVTIDQAKGLFFDRAKVTSGTDRAQRRVLSKFGAFVRRGARSSIRKRKRSSAPGSPPSSHTGRLKRHIYFLYEPQRRSVIIGPVLLSGSTDAPRLLEHGGAVVRRKRKKTVRVTYKPRPFMGPAFEREKPKLSAMWRDSVRS